MNHNPDGIGTVHAEPGLILIPKPFDAFPPLLWPYLEIIGLDKPTGTKLVFWPFAWGLTMAAHSTDLSPMEYALGLVKFLATAFIIRCSACTINDILDRGIDSVVERTKNRPLASGRMSVPSAFLYVSVQYIVGTVFFYFTLKGLALWVALFQLLPIFAIYPVFKRVTYWSQAWLGFAMNLGFVISWVSTTNTLNIPLLLSAMVGCWCWTMIYATIYACQDNTHTRNTRVKIYSTASLFGIWIRPLLTSCGIIFLGALAVAGIVNGQGAVFFVVSVGGLALHLSWQYVTVNHEVLSSCRENFDHNGQLGWIIWSGMLLDYFASNGCKGSG